MKSLPLSVAREAAAEVFEAADWYEKQSQGLVHAFLELVDQTLKEIAERPYQFPQVYRDTRRALLKRSLSGSSFGCGAIESEFSRSCTCCQATPTSTR
jgi:hypothetical protein